MLNENQINLLPERICERLSRINSEYLTNVGRIIYKTGELRPTDIHQLQRMYDYGTDMKKVINKLSEVSEKNINEIYDIFDIVAKENYKFAKPFYKAKELPYIPYEENDKLKKYVRAMAENTVNEYKNLTQHTAFAIFDKDGKSIAPLFAANKDKVATTLSETYTKVTDYAVSKVQLGVESYNKAMKDVIKALAGSGIKTVDYATGYSRRLDTAVRQNILWGVKECNQKTADYVGEEFGADGYEISYHTNPRDTHADMAGKQFAIGDGKLINGKYYPPFSDVAHLLEEYGCLHFKFSILLGVSQPAYSDEQLEEFKENDKRTFEFEGKSYTINEAKDIRNTIEKKIIRQKELINIARESGQEVLQREGQRNVNLLMGKYHSLCQSTGLPTRIERMQVNGYRKVKTIGELKKPMAWISDNEESLEVYKNYLNRVASGRFSLKRRHNFLFNKVPESGNWARVKPHQVSLDDLAALTAFSGDEFALFSAKSYKIIYHGEKRKWSIPNDVFEEICKEKMIWEGHSHPYPGDLRASPEDIKTLKLLTWQKKSTIIDVEGSTKDFTTLYADIINDIFKGG